MKNLLYLKYSCRNELINMIYFSPHTTIRFQQLGGLRWSYWSEHLTQENNGNTQGFKLASKLCRQSRVQQKQRSSSRFVFFLPLDYVPPQGNLTIRYAILFQDLLQTLIRWGVSPSREWKTAARRQLHHQEHHNDQKVLHLFFIFMNDLSKSLACFCFGFSTITECDYGGFLKNKWDEISAHVPVMSVDLRGIREDSRGFRGCLYFCYSGQILFCFFFFLIISIMIFFFQWKVQEWKLSTPSRCVARGLFQIELICTQVVLRSFGEHLRTPAFRKVLSN